MGGPVSRQFQQNGSGQGSVEWFRTGFGVTFQGFKDLQLKAKAIIWPSFGTCKTVIPSTADLEADGHVKVDRVVEPPGMREPVQFKALSNKKYYANDNDYTESNETYYT